MRFIVAALAIAAIVIPASPARAQVVRAGSVPDRSFELAVALALNGIDDVNARPLCEDLVYPCTGGRGFPDTGIAVAWAGNFGDLLGLIVDVGVYRERWEAPEGYRPSPGPKTNTILSFGIGPRVYVPVSDRTRVFGQVLWGARLSEAVEGGNAVQPGGGVDIKTSAGLHLRFELDRAIMRDAPAGPRGIGGTRALIGIAVPLPR